MKAIMKKDHHTIVMTEVERPLLKTEEDVIIKVLGIGICRTDIYVAKGVIQSPDNIILGHELAGIVVETTEKNKHLFNKLVSVNPFFDKKFMGLDQNGALAEFIKLKASEVFVYDKPIAWQVAAYLEPVAAAMAVTKVPMDLNATIAIFGNNRIADLTYHILKSKNYNVVKIDAHTPPTEYSIIIETSLNQNNFDYLVSLLAHNGTLIIKSRYRKTLKFIPSSLLEKEVNLHFVNYGNFSEAKTWVENHVETIEEFVGETYSWQRAEEIFNLAERDENKKLFLSIDIV